VKIWLGQVGAAGSHSRGIGILPMIGPQADADACCGEFVVIRGTCGIARLFAGHRLRPIIGRMPMPRGATSEVLGGDCDCD